MPATITKIVAFLLLLVVFAGAVFGIGYAIFAQDSYVAPPPVNTALPDTRPRPLPQSDTWRPQVPSESRGVLLVDAIHRNSFLEAEISTLLSAVVSRGYEVEFLGNYLSAEETKRLPLMEEKLRRADAFLVVVPRTAFSEAENRQVERFVRRGGRLLLIADPTRIHLTNSVAERFGVRFQPDYLYNQADSDLNFQNIFVREFQPEEVTAGVNAIALYTAGSIQSSGPGLAFTDLNTRSSLTADVGGLSPIAFGNTRNVLAIADLTFLIPPHNSVLDNGQLMSNIADYLTTGDREYDLDDFPHFYGGAGADGVDIVLARPDLLAAGTAMKNGLDGFGVNSSIRSAEDPSRDTVFLGLHEDSSQVGGYLQAAGIRVDDTLGGPFVTDLGLENLAVTVLDANPNRHVLIVLADTQENLDKAVAQLLGGQFRQDLVSELTAVSALPGMSK